MIKLTTLADFFRERLVSILSQYLKDFSHSNIPKVFLSILVFNEKISLGINPNIEMKDLKIRDDLLVLKSIPLVISDGRIGKIRISVPALYTANAARIDIENVEIHLRLLVEQRNDSQHQNLKRNSSREINYKEKRLLDWETKMQNYFKELSPPSWIKKIVDNILKNMIICVKRVRIYYESYSFLNVPGYVKISLQELNIHTTDSNWFPTFHSAPDVHYREINLIGLSITLNVFKNNISSPLLLKSKSDLPSTGSPYIRMKGYSRTVNHNKENWSNLVENRNENIQKDNTYILFPLNLTLQIKRKLNFSEEFNEDPRQTIWIEVKDPITIIINQNQIQFLRTLNEHLSSLDIVQKNIHLRPNQSPTENPKAWWIYAYKSILETKGRNNAAITPALFMKRKKYIKFYKSKQKIVHVPWLPSLSPSEKRQFDLLEQEIPLEYLLKFREWAFLEIRLEAKRFFTSDRNVQGIKPLFDIWSNVINNEELFTNNEEEKQRESILLTPVEQNDLYEILAYDKAKVLESYLKGERNDPKDLLTQFNIRIQSFYILITELKENSTNKNLDDKRSRVASVKDWFLQKDSNRIPNEPPVSVLRSSQDYSIQQEVSHDNIASVNQSASLTQKEAVFVTNEDYFHDNTFKSESLQSHLRDIYKDSMDHFLPELIDNSGIKDSSREIREEKLIVPKWWDQNLLLLIEIVGIKVTINKWRNGRIATKKFLEVDSLMISTALNFLRALKDRDSKIIGNLEGYLKQDEIVRTILTNDFQFAALNNQENFNPLISFLQKESRSNYLAFIQQVEKDRRSIGEFYVPDIQAYHKFFDPENSCYIFPSREIMEQYKKRLRQNNNNYITIEEVVLKAYKYVEQDIMTNLLPSFLFYHGVLVLPTILQKYSNFETKADEFPPKKEEGKNIKAMLNKLKRFPTLIQNASILKFLRKSKVERKESEDPSVKTISISFDFSGFESPFRIQKIDFDKKITKSSDFSKEFLKVLSQSYEEIRPDSFINLSLRPITIFLSTEALHPLMQFLKESSPKLVTESPDLNNNEKHNQIFKIEDYQNLLSCIDYNPNKSPQSVARNEVYIMTNISSLSIEIHSFHSFNLHQRKLVFSCKDIEFEVKTPFEGFNSNPPNKKSNIIKKDAYQISSFKIEELEIYEWSDASHNQSNIPFLKTKIIAFVHNSIYKNHPLLTDKKMEILFPFVHVHIDDGLVLFSEVLKIISSSPKNVSSENIRESWVTENPRIGVSNNKRNFLINKLNMLKKDHKIGAKNCKHCIFYHKKSSLLLNIFIGDMMNYCDDLDGSPFDNLKSPQFLSMNSNRVQGLNITIRHSMTLKNHEPTHTILSLPFLSITKDVGFFKDNIIVHCSESLSTLNGPEISIKPENKTAILQLTPLLKVKNNFVKDLDDNFWRYFLSVEKDIMLKGSFHEESIVEISEEDISIPYLSQDCHNMSHKERRSSQKGESSIYLLSLRRKYVHKDLLKVFDINGAEKNFPDIFTLKIKEISLFFNSLQDFVSLTSTFYSLKFINSLLEVFVSQNYQTQKPYVDLSQQILKNKRTLKDLDNMLALQKIQIIVEKIKSQVNIQYPTSLWLLEIRDCIFETPQDPTTNTVNKLNISFPIERIQNLFYIQSVSFSSTLKFQGSIKNIHLKYQQNKEKLSFYIDSLFYQSVQDPLLTIIEMPLKEEIPKGKKALEIDCLFEDSILSKIDVSAASIKASLSQEYLSNELSSFALFGSLFTSECRNLPRILTSLIFQKIAFEGAYSIWKELKELEKPKRRNFDRTPTLGNIQILQNFILSIVMDRMTINFIKDNITFAILDVLSLKYILNAVFDYEAEVGKISLIPYDSYYDNFFVNMDKSKPLTIKLLKDQHPLLLVDNCKVIYMQRIIQEIKQFVLEIQTEIIEHVKTITSYRLAETKEIIRERDQPIRNHRIFTIKFQNSCFIIPRNCNSKDLIVLFCESFDFHFDKENRIINAPNKDLSNIIPLQNLVIDLQEAFHKIETSGTSIKINISEMKIYYKIQNRNVKLGASGLCSIDVFIPDSKIIKQLWNQLSQTNVEFENFRLSLNIGSLEEARLLVEDNTKEKSKLFKTNLDIFSKIYLEIMGKKINLELNKTKIERNIAQNIIDMDQKVHNRNNREEDSDYKHYLNRIVQKFTK